MNGESGSTLDYYAANWQRHDWRQSFLAPQVQIIQALTRCGQTASGAGHSRPRAVGRCIGETAEVLALAALPPARRAAFCSQRDGLAAGETTAAADAGALAETCERHAVWRWWRGEAGALPIARRWLDQQRVTSRMAGDRRGAAIRRISAFWRIDLPGSPHVMICRSKSAGGQDWVLGFGADPDPLAAVLKAWREMLLMEMNLMEVMAARQTGNGHLLTAARDAISRITRHGPALLPETGPAAVAPEMFGPLDLDTAAGYLGRPPVLQDISQPGAPLRVSLCSVAGPAPTEEGPFS